MARVYQVNDQARATDNSPYLLALMTPRCELVVPSVVGAWWAHLEFTRINTTPTFPYKKFEDARDVATSCCSCQRLAHARRRRSPKRRHRRAGWRFEWKDAPAASACIRIFATRSPHVRSGHFTGLAQIDNGVELLVEMNQSLCWGREAQLA